MKAYLKSSASGHDFIWHQKDIGSEGTAAMDLIRKKNINGRKVIKNKKSRADSQIQPSSAVHAPQAGRRTHMERVRQVRTELKQCHSRATPLAQRTDTGNI